jgi:methionyl-tRNA formyltransferase
MNFVFFGSFHISAGILEKMVSGGLMPSVVVCSPDRPAGRKKIMTAPAIKQLILEKNWPIKILQPEKLPVSSLEIRNWKLEIGQVDLAVVMGYPHIISDSILKIPKLGTIGIHPSLLPKYRGASPIQSVLLHDEKETGVTLYVMDAKMDHGAIISNSQFPISSDETHESLIKKVIDVAGSLAVSTIPSFVAGKIQPQPQDHSQATFCDKFSTEDAKVDMQTEPIEKIYNKIRALNPEPGTWTMNLPGYEGKRVKLLSAKIKDGKLFITEIQPDGKTPMPINQEVKR